MEPGPVALDELRSRYFVQQICSIFPGETEGDERPDTDADVVVDKTLDRSEDQNTGQKTHRTRDNGNDHLEDLQEDEGDVRKDAKAGEKLVKCIRRMKDPFLESIESKQCDQSQA